MGRQRKSPPQNEGVKKWRASLFQREGDSEGPSRRVPDGPNSPYRSREFGSHHVDAISGEDSWRVTDTRNPPPFSGDGGGFSQTRGYVHFCDVLPGAQTQKAAACNGEQIEVPRQASPKAKEKEKENSVTETRRIVLASPSPHRPNL